MVSEKHYLVLFRFLTPCNVLLSYAASIITEPISHRQSRSAMRGRAREREVEEGRQFVDSRRSSFVGKRPLPETARKLLTTAMRPLSLTYFRYYS